MKKNVIRGVLVIAFVMALLQGGNVYSSNDPVATMIINPTMVYWDPQVSYDQLVLTVTGNEGAIYRQVFNAGSTPVFDLYDNNGDLFPDGACTYELTVVPYMDPVTRDLLEQSREMGTDVAASGVSIPSGLSQYGYFTITDGLVLLNTVREKEDTIPGVDGLDQVQTTSTKTTKTTSIDSPLDIIHQDDVIITNSLCVGFDCVNGENFGFDTLVLKENNLRLFFNDTSSSGSFPYVDWRLTANDTSNGGANRFSIDDATNNRTILNIEANSQSNSIYIDSAGYVGFNTSTPVTSLHARSGNTPTLRLEQDGSNGFTAQTWDVAGNEANFFIRDATNGSQLPFRIQPSAPSNAMYIASSGKVGFNTTTPDSMLHIYSNTSNAKFHVQETNSSVIDRAMMQLDNNGGVNLVLQDNSTGKRWILQNTAETFRINLAGSGVAEFNLDTGGNLTIAGHLTASGSTYPPDYVFDGGYKLLPLQDLQEFIKAEKHLPGVPSANELKNGINMTQMQMKLLEKVEELTLYTIEQEKLIKELQSRLEKIESK